MEQSVLANNFSYHAPDEDRAKLHGFLRQEAYSLALTFNTRLPESREKSLALTKLEEATMWANAALARSK